MPKYKITFHQVILGVNDAIETITATNKAEALKIAEHMLKNAELNWESHYKEVDHDFIHEIEEITCP